MLSDELVESIHEAQRISTVSPSLAAHIEVLLVSSGYHPKLATDKTEGPGTDEPHMGPRVRRDLPQVRTSAGGLLAKAVAAAKPGNAERALQDFRDNVYARSARTTWCKICEAWQQEPVSLTPELIEMVGASFRFGGYPQLRTILFSSPEGTRQVEAGDVHACI